MDLRKAKGNEAECLAANFLSKKGYKIIERNFRNKIGEIDIIAKDGKTIVFIEVRSSSGTLFSSAAESITNAKIKKIIKVAQSYIAFKKLVNVSFRFDVVIVNNGKVELIKNAFTA